MIYPRKIADQRLVDARRYQRIAEEEKAQADVARLLAVEARAKLQKCKKGL